MLRAAFGDPPIALPDVKASWGMTIAVPSHPTAMSRSNSKSMLVAEHKRGNILLDVQQLLSFNPKSWLISISIFVDSSGLYLYQGGPPETTNNTSWNDASSSNACPRRVCFQNHTNIHAKP
jgi:hypothetical protein